MTDRINKAGRMLSPLPVGEGQGEGQTGNIRTNPDDFQFCPDSDHVTSGTYNNGPFNRPDASGSPSLASNKLAPNPMTDRIHKTGRTPSPLPPGGGQGKGDGQTDNIRTNPDDSQLRPDSDRVTLGTYNNDRFRSSGCVRFKITWIQQLSLNPMQDEIDKTERKVRVRANRPLTKCLEFYGRLPSHPKSLARAAARAKTVLQISERFRREPVCAHAVWSAGARGNVNWKGDHV